MMRWVARAGLVWALSGNAWGGGVPWDVVLEGGEAPATSLYSSPRPSLVDSPSGPLVALGASTTTANKTVMRLDPLGGPPMWRTTLPVGGDPWNPPRVMAGPDGTSLVVDTVVTRLAADGARLWTAPGSFSHYQGFPLDEVDSGTVLADGSVVLAVRRSGVVELRHLDADDGRLLATATVPVPGSPINCAVVGMFAQGTTAYALDPCTAQLRRIDIAPLRVSWSVPASSLHAADATGIYTGTTDGTTLRKLDPASGAVLWSTAVSPGFSTFVVLPSGTLVGRRDTTIEAFDGSTGASLWSHVAGGSLGEPGANANGVLIVGRDDTSPAYVARLAPDTGAVVWRADLPLEGWYAIELDRAAFDGSRVIVLGTRCAGGSVLDACEVATWRGDAATGTGFLATPVAVQSGLVSAVAPRGDGTSWTATLEWSATGQQLRLIRHRLDDGSVLQTFERPAPMPVLSASAANRVSLRVTAQGDLVVLYAYNLMTLPSDAAVLKIDGTDGSLVWQRNLYDPSTGQTGVGAELLSTDSTGNVMLGLRESAPSMPGTNPGMGTRRIVRLAASTGQPQWYVEFRAPQNAWETPPLAIPLGDDLLIRETPAFASPGLRRLSGADGHVAWTNASAPGGGTSIPEPGSILVSSTQRPLLVARLDASTGDAVWTVSYDHPDDLGYQSLEAITLSPAQDRYIVSTRRSTTTSGGSTWQPLMFALDRASGQAAWVNRFEDNPVPTSSFATPRAVADGAVYVSQSFDRGGALSAFDIATGESLGSRVTHHLPLLHPHRDDKGPGYVFAQPSPASLAFGTGLRRHDAPPAFTLAGRAIAPAVFGDLRVTLDTAVAAAPGDLALDVTFTVTNAASTPAEDIDAVLGLAAGALVAAPTCMIGSLPCMLEQTPTSLEGRFDLPAGAVLTVTTRFQGLRADLDYAFEASAYGPDTFAEPDLKDNRGQYRYLDTILRSGFD